jgi:hypothetical protein
VYFLQALLDHASLRAMAFIQAMPVFGPSAARRIRQATIVGPDGAPVPRARVQATRYRLGNGTIKSTIARRH